MSNNRRRGNSWERACAEIFRKWFPDIVTARSESKSRDDQGVDLMNKDEKKNGALPYDFQCKNSSKCVSYHKVISRMPQDQIPVILHKMTEKKGKRFYEVGTYAIMKMDDFLTLVDKIENHE